MHLPELPFGDPVLVFGLALAIFLALPLVFERLRVPGLIGLIVAGAVVGPNGIGLLERDATIILLGTVGLLYLMFLVGLELDLNEFNRHRKHSVTFGLLSFLLPQVTGTVLSLLLGYSFAASALLGAMFASHTLVAYPIASRFGIVKTGAVTTVLGATLLTDMLALLVLAVVAGAREGVVGLGFWLELLASLSIYGGIVLLVVPRIGRWFFRRVSSDGGAQYTFTLAMLFAFAGLAEMAGIEPIIGALLVGFALNRLIPEHGSLMNRIKFVAETIFVPFFLLSVGMLVDVRAFADRSAWVTIIALVLATVGSKAVAAKVTQRIFGFAPEDGWVMFGLSVSHAAATMAITLVGYEIGLFDETIVNAIVVIILVTCLIGPWTVERSGRKLAFREEQKPYEPGTAPRRILIPISNPATSDALLDLAFLLRGGGSEEPLYPLMVVPEDGSRMEARVAEAETMLGHAVTRAAAADVPVTPLTRVGPNIASGIARGMAESRSSMVIIGWDGGRAAAGHWIFGSVLDQLLKQTRRLIMVAKLGHPLNTTKRLVVVLPPRIHHHPGFYGAVGAVKLIASQLGASISVLGLDNGVSPYEHHFGRVKPETPTTFKRVVGWDALLPELRKAVRPDDLVVLLSARRGTLTWHPKLERLPAEFAKLVPESFVIVYPSRIEREAEAQIPDLVIDFPQERVVRLNNTSFVVALGKMLRVAFPDRRTSRALRRALVESEREFSSEILPGVALPHARYDGLEQSVLVLGVSDEGIEFPRAGAPIHLICLVVSPGDRPEQHLRQLAEIARFLRSPEHVGELIERYAPGVSTDWLAPAVERAGVGDPAPPS